MNQASNLISADDFIALHPNSKRTVIDVRTPAEVNNECYAGAHNLPVQEVSAEKLLALLTTQACSNDEPVYLLCGSGQRATIAASQLKDSLPNKVYVISGGIQALRQCGASLQKGKGNTISLERQVRIAAGSLVVLGVVLGVSINAGFLGLAAFVGAGLVFAGVTDTCAMGMALARMPWNQAA